MSESNQVLAERYIAVWNEPDPSERRRQVEELWGADGWHFTPTREFQGYEALEARVDEAHARFVRDGDYRFEVDGAPLEHHGLIKFHWRMVHQVTGAVDARGSDVLHLAGDGRIASDHQFTEPLERRP